MLKLRACKHSDLPKHTKVINKSELPYFFWIRIPSEIAKRFELYKLEEVGRCETEIKYLGSLSQEFRRPWIRIVANILDVDPGQHIYKMSFVDKMSDDIAYVFFSYILQDDNPEKPYIYMRG